MRQGCQRVENRHAVRGRFGFSGCAASPALPGCGARIALRSACTLRPLPLLRLAASAAGGARLCSSLRFPTVTKKYVLLPYGDSNVLFCSIGIASVGAGPPLAIYSKITFLTVWTAPSGAVFYISSFLLTQNMLFYICYIVEFSPFHKERAAL